MILKNVSLVLLFICSSAIVAQKTRYWEWGGGLGMYHYQGDLNDEFSVGNFIREAGPRFMAFVKDNPKPWFTYGFEFGYGNSTVKDIDYGRSSRNWIVFTESFDLNICIEWNFLRYGKWHLENKISPYIKVGGGGLIVSSKGQNKVELPESIELHPYTYGSYNLFYGYGFKSRLSYTTSFYLQFTRHYTGTDKMDGFIDRSKVIQNNDQYITIILGLSKLIF